MKRSMVFMIVMLLYSSVSSASDTYPPQQRIRHLLDTLPGSWDGAAIETPVGRVEYDINFKRCSDGALLGIADTGASLHYWRFKETQETLHLHFHSTFTGNPDSTLLLPSKVKGNSLQLFAPKKDMLTLSFTLTESQIDIRVFHYGKPHVHIVLKSKILGTKAVPEQDQHCHNLPASLLDP